METCITETTLQIKNEPDDEHQQIYASNQHSNVCIDNDKKITINNDKNNYNYYEKTYNEQLCKDSLFAERNHEELLDFIKDEFNIEETRLKIENDFDNGEQKIYENSSISFGDSNNETILNDNKNSDDDNKYCPHFKNNDIDWIDDKDLLMNEIDYNEPYLKYTNVECRKDEKSDDQHKTNSKSPNQCKICNKIFSRKTYLSVHLRIHTGDKPHQCNICDKKFTVKWGLKQHSLTHANEKIDQCNVCDKSFTRKDDVQEHVSLHIDKKPNQCHICDERFVKMSNKHLLTHTDKKPYECDICNQKFTTKYYLKVHLSIHTNGKSYQCHICGRKYVTNGNLKKHSSTHSDKEPYQCNICGKKFKLNDRLKVHLLIHSDKKAYKCHICNTRFSTNGSLKKHLMIHSDEKPYQCYICNKKFRRKYVLTSHLLTHDDDNKPY